MNVIIGSDEEFPMELAEELKWEKMEELYDLLENKKPKWLDFKGEILGVYIPIEHGSHRAVKWIHSRGLRLQYDNNICKYHGKYYFYQQNKKRKDYKYQMVELPDDIVVTIGYRIR